MSLKPIYEDEILLVYTTDPQAGREFTVDRLMADGIGLIRMTYNPQEANQAGTLAVDVRWGSVAAPAKAYQACFSLRDAQEVSRPLLCTEPAPGWPTSQWQANEMVRGSYSLPIAADLEPGDYELELSLVEDGQQVAVGETAVLGSVHIHPFQPENSSDVCWDDQICLLGYDLQQRGETLELTNFWQAPHELDTSYKLFVHLVDAASGEVVVQSDSIPRNWTYATDIWEPGEVVRDAVSLPLEEAPPGQYEIWLGWYDAEGSTRLAVCPSGDCRVEMAESLKLDTILVAAKES